MWNVYLQGFRTFLQLEKSLSPHSIEAYLRDVNKLVQFFDIHDPKKSVSAVSLKDLEQFIIWINELGLEEQSQARIISGLKSFFKYLLLEDVIAANPADLLQEIGRAHV